MNFFLCPNKKNNADIKYNYNELFFILRNDLKMSSL